jgi:trigger factor
MKEEAEQRVRGNLTLEAIGKAENIEVSEEDVNAELEKMAEMYKMPIEDIKKAIGGAEGVKSDLRIRKTVEFLVENSVTKA